MNNNQAIAEYYKALNKWHEAVLITSKDSEVVLLSPVAFNVYAFEKAEELQLSERDMNRVISAWACTLDKEPPTYLFKNQNVQNDELKRI